jgi:hypothetical protein
MERTQDMLAQLGKKPAAFCAALHHKRLVFKSNFRCGFMTLHGVENTGKCYVFCRQFGKFAALHMHKLSYKSKT